MASQLKKQYRDIIKADSLLLGMIATATNKSIHTIIRWVDINDERLTMTSVINQVREKLKLPKSVVLTEEVGVEQDKTTADAR